MGVDQLALSHLQQSLSVKDVLEVLNNIYPYILHFASSMILSAPSHKEFDQSHEDEFNARQNHKNTTQEMFADLAETCLKIIDKHGAYLLKTDLFCLLDMDVVKLILSGTHFC